MLINGGQLGNAGPGHQDPCSVEAESDGSRIYVTANSFSGRDLVALVPGAKWRSDDARWEAPLTWAAVKQLRYLFGGGLAVGANLVKWGHDERHRRIDPAMDLREAIEPWQKGDFDSSLYPYQVTGAQFLVAAEQAILSDQPGAGKTATSVSAARQLEALPALVVAPKSTLVSWSREIERWWPGTPVYLATGTAEKRRAQILQAAEVPGIVVATWESVRRHSRLSPYGSLGLSAEEKMPKELNQVPFRLVIADEAHRMQNPQSKQTRALWAVGDMPSVEYRWALTGTPLTKQIDTLWPILRFLNKEEWPSRVAFIDRYALTRRIPWGSGVEVIGMNPSNEDEFREIFEPRFRRMPKEVILPQLPPIQRVRRYLEMSPKQAQGYSSMAEKMIAMTDSGELLIADNPATKTLRMVQFSSACVDLPPDVSLDIHGTQKGQKAKLIDPSNKLDALMDDLPDLLGAGESVVVFAVSRQLIEMAEARLQRAKISYSVVKGNQSMAERQGHVDRFQNGQVSLILVVVAAGGVGLTLTAGRIAIFLQRSWSFVENHQAEGRIHRLGSEVHDSIQIIDYLSSGTVDQVVVEVAEGKEIQLEAIVRDRDAVKRMLQGDTNIAFDSHPNI